MNNNKSQHSLAKRLSARVGQAAFSLQQLVSTESEKDIHWFHQNRKLELFPIHDFENPLAKKDNLYKLATETPEKFTDILVGHANLERLKCGESVVFSANDIARLKNLMRPEYIEKAVNLRKASYLVELAQSPFFETYLCADWSARFDTIKKRGNVDEIRERLFSIVEILLLGFDIYNVGSFQWNIVPINYKSEELIQNIIARELVPIGPKKQGLYSTGYESLFTYLDILRSLRGQDDKTILENDLAWFTDVVKPSDMLRKDFNFVNPEATKDPLYTSALENPEEFMKNLVSASRISEIIVNGSPLLTELDLKRIIQFGPPYQISRIINVRRASYLLELASVPFLQEFINDSTWIPQFKRAKDIESITPKNSNEDDSKGAIRTMLSGIADLLVEGFDLVLDTDFQWSANIPKERFSKIRHIMLNETLPTGPGLRFNKHKFHETYAAFDIMRKKKSVGGVRKTLKKLFCECIKKVRAKTQSESAAIAICTKSVLHSRGKTFRKFKCKGNRPFLNLQKRI